MVHISIDTPPGGNMRHSRRHIAWQAFRDGNRWTQLDLSDAPAVAAVTEIEPGRFTVSTVVELPGTWGSAREAEQALEDWMADVDQASKRETSASSAKPPHRLTIAKVSSLQAWCGLRSRPSRYSCGSTQIATDGPHWVLSATFPANADSGQPCATPMSSVGNILRFFWINLTRVDKFNF